MTAMSALARLCGGPLALDDRHLASAEQYALRVLDMDWPEVESGALKPYRLAGGMAQIGLRGIILPELMGYVGLPFATGCAELRGQLAAALADDDVRGILLEVDSPGGFVTGVDDAAAAIRAARAAKPVAAVVEGSAFSAAYWLTAQADTIACTRTAGVGHIGVLAVHYDMRNAYAAQGVEATVFASGARKADGHPLRPLSDEAAAQWQAACDSLREVFATAVGEGRGSRFDKAAALATEALAYDTPALLAEALRLGLIDAILPAQDARAAFAASLAAPAAT